MKTLKRTPDPLNSNVEFRNKRQNKFNNILLIKNINQPNQGKLVVKDNLSFIKFFNKPLEPKMENSHEVLAQIKLDNYKPSIIDKITGTAKIELKWLNYLVKAAIGEDLKEYKLKYKDYLLDLEIWEKTENTLEDFNNKNLNFSNNNSFSELQNSD